MTATTAESARKKAKKWRAVNGYTGRGGVVIVYSNRVQGWVNALRNPEHWRPGCIAVQEDGVCFVTAGGNDDDGAGHWRPCA